MVTLKIVDAEGRSDDLHFEGPKTITIGRSPECDVMVSDLRMARCHCILDIRSSKVLIRSDLKGRGVIYVNGVMYEAKARHTPDGSREVEPYEVELKDGDEVRLGGTIIVVLISNPAI